VTEAGNGEARITVADWLASRTPEPPERLLERIRETLGPALDGGMEEFPDAAIEGALTLMRRVMREPQSREEAVDLLAADALVTYAFEAVAEDPAALDARAQDAIRRIAKLAVGARA
jgi:hypothetical protein